MQNEIITGLIAEFNESPLQKIFEIETPDGEFHIYHIIASNKGLEAGGCANVGFMPYGVIVEWDDYFGLDGHLEGLYDACYHHAMES